MNTETNFAEGSKARARMAEEKRAADEAKKREAEGKAAQITANRRAKEDAELVRKLRVAMPTATEQEIQAALPEYRKALMLSRALKS